MILELKFFEVWKESTSGKVLRGMKVQATKKIRKREKINKERRTLKRTRLGSFPRESNISLTEALMTKLMPTLNANDFGMGRGV